MFRWLAVVLILCVGTYVVMDIALGKGGWKQTPSDASTGGEQDTSDHHDRQASRSADGESIRPSNRNLTQDKLHVDQAQIQVVEKQEVASEKDGILLFIATPLTREEIAATSMEDRERFFREGKWIEGKRGQGALGYLMVEESKPQDYTEDKLFKFADAPDKVYRIRESNAEAVTPGHVRVGLQEYVYRKLEVGDRVKRGQLLALVDPKLALDELEIKVAGFDAAEAERRAAEKTRDEGKKRYEGILAARRVVQNAVSNDETRAAELTWQRYLEEEIAKRGALRKAERELNAASTTLHMHEIKAHISGIVKVIYKNKGDSVKALDPVLQIQNPDLLRVEGTVEVQEGTRLKRGMIVSVEPSRPDQPRMVLRGHTGEITCVAVSPGSQPRIVSGSEDRSLRVWDSVTGQELWTVENRAAVRSVACTGPGAEKRNLILAGFADGVARLYNLDDMTQGSVVLGQVNQGPVNSVAFSPDGKYCLTAGDDRSIQIWKVGMEDGKPSVDKRPLHRLSAAHKSAVTCVQFIPTEKTDQVQFLSVGRDDMLVWEMVGENPPVRISDFDQRSGDVPVLGTDGKRVLFDQGTELRLRSLADRTRVEGRLRNPQGAASFSTLALFAPDGKTILSNCASEGRVQLWRAPRTMGRGTELRQLVWPTGVVTCGAFAPRNPFVVTGTQDHCVLVWKMPSDDEIEGHLDARIINVGQFINDSSRQVPLTAELVEKPPSWVIPGGTATIVINPGETER